MKYPALIHAFLMVLVCGGCSAAPSILPIEKRSLADLPQALRKENLSLRQILDEYDNLSAEERTMSLEYFLGEKDITKRERCEAAYLLGRLKKRWVEISKDKGNICLQLNREGKKGIAFFEEAQKLPPLKNKALLHMSELAAISGDEKAVRRYLGDLLVVAKEVNIQAAAYYALAQSYIRTNQLNDARVLLQKLRLEYGDTDYALGAEYYLASFEYAQFEFRCASKSSREKLVAQISTERLNGILPLYLDYLAKSPTGRFAKDILAKLERLTELNGAFVGVEEARIIGLAYLKNGQYRDALRYWQKTGAQKFAYEMAEAYLASGQVQLAQKLLVKGVNQYPQDRRAVILAANISEKLGRAAALSLWNTLYHAKVAGLDAVLWNLAVRNTGQEGAKYYQQIIDYYPQSAYAAEAQWRIFWPLIKRADRTKSLQIANWCVTAAKKYNKTSLASRFLFWAGHLNELAIRPEWAIRYYSEAATDYPNTYYGQRAEAKSLLLNKKMPDNYFRIEASGSLRGTKWDCPVPQAALKNLSAADAAQVVELVYLRQYDEAIGLEQRLPPEWRIFLLAKLGRSLEAINEANQYLNQGGLIGEQEKQNIYQYAYPLKFRQEICSSAKDIGFRSPLFMQALIREESRYEPKAISATGAIGLCQLMPGTASELAGRLHIEFDRAKLFQPDYNIRLGTAYFASLLSKFKDDGLLAIASYNAGCGKVKERLLSKESLDTDWFVEDFPYHETRDYIAKVFASYHLYKKLYD